MTAPAPDALKALMDPHVITIIGASDNPRAVGGRPLAYLLNSPFPGTVLPVNPRRSTVQGRESFASVDSLPVDPDVAIIAVPAVAVPDTLRACAARGTKAAIVLSAGFAEVGEAGDRLQTEVAHVVAESGIRVLGPNCLGVANILRSIPLTFASYFADPEAVMRPGRIALVSQSGSYATLALDQAFRQGIGISHYVTTGNEVDLQWSDIVEHLAQDPGVDVVAGYLEAVRDGERFRRALRTAQERSTAVVVLKSGRTPASRVAAQAHTGTMSGDDAVFDAVLTKYGAHRATDLRELLIGAQTLTRFRHAGRSIAIVTASGGLAATLVDIAEQAGLDVPPLSLATRERLGSLMPAHGSSINPVDVADGVISDPQGAVHDVIAAIADSGEVDAVGFFFGASAYLEPTIGDLLVKVADNIDIPLVACWVGGTGEFPSSMNLKGVLTFADPSDAIAALAFAARAGTPCDWGSTPSPVSHPQDAVEGGDLLDQLRSFGLPVVPRAVAASAADLIRAAAEMGDSVYLKANLPEVAHKTEHGAVLGPVASSDVAAIGAFVRRFPQAESFEAQSVVLGDWELIVAARDDATFGAVTTIGFGGIFTNLMDTHLVFAEPLSFDEFVTRLRSSPLGVTADGFRGLARLDLAELFDLVGRARAFLHVQGLEILEFNPVIVQKETGRLILVDAWGAQPAD